MEVGGMEDEQEEQAGQDLRPPSLLLASVSPSHFPPPLLIPSLLASLLPPFLPSGCSEPHLHIGIAFFVCVTGLGGGMGRHRFCLKQILLIISIFLNTKMIVFHCTCQQYFKTRCSHKLNGDLKSSILAVLYVKTSFSTAS